MHMGQVIEEAQAGSSPGYFKPLQQPTSAALVHQIQQAM
jgi:hypothetical protein